MADVTRSRCVHRPDPDSRGQLILVTALSLAILFVTLALILNTAIYTENLATRSGDIGGGTDAVRYHDAARDGVGGVIDYANAYNNSSHETLHSNVSGGVESFQNTSVRLFLSGDRAVEVTFDGTENGTRIAQTDASRNFTNASGTANDWILASSVDNTRAVVINVTDDTELDSPNSEFRMKVTGDSGNTWYLNVTDAVEIVVKNATGPTVTCTASSTEPYIDVSAGTVDGEPCEGLVFAEGLSTPYDIEFENADNIQGTFSLVVDDDSIVKNVGGNDDLAEDGLGQPFAAYAIYSADVTVVYETPRLYYNTSVRVAPDEADG